MRFSGQVIWVTGASAGIGEALALGRRNEWSRTARRVAARLRARPPGSAELFEKAVAFRDAVGGGGGQIEFTIGIHIEAGAQELAKGTVAVKRGGPSRTAWS